MADRLHELVMHGYSACIVQSAEYVVPFLVRLCDSKRLAVLRAALPLFSDLTTEPFHTEVELFNSEMFERTQAAMRAGHDIYSRLLHAPDARTRRAASDLLSLLDEVWRPATA